MKISYCITVCKEFIEIQKLIEVLLEHKRLEDEVVVLYDSAHGDEEVENYLRSKSINGEFNWHKDEFKHHFADWKNKFNNLCDGDYIFQIDADEVPHENLLKNLPDVLELNSVDLITVPRINTVKGLTEEHIKKWQWRVSKEGWINFPDLQTRIYRNTDSIKWESKVHERITGFKIVSALPLEEEWCLYHHKSIEKQEQQNLYYETL